MRRSARFWHVVLPLCLSANACSTHYAPQTGPKISVVMSGGMPAYQKDGETYSHGFAGSGLVEVVEGDDEAVEAAETYHERQVGGLLAIVGALVCGGVGVAVLARDSREPSDESVAIASTALACMLGASIAGLVLVTSAQPYQWDAINIYNDHVEQRLQMLRCSPQHCPQPYPPYTPFAPHPPPAPTAPAPPPAPPTSIPAP